MKDLLMDTLLICLDYRNRAAHGGRIYGYTPKRASNIVQNAIVYPSKYLKAAFLLENLSSYTFLSCILSFFKHDNAFLMVTTEINRQVGRHLELFPEDKEYIESLVGSPVTSETFVYMSKSAKSKVMHSISNCSGLLEPRRINIKDIAENSGYYFCHKCTNRK